MTATQRHEVPAPPRPDPAPPEPMPEPEPFPPGSRSSVSRPR
jgi:hypothetical protein